MSSQVKTINILGVTGSIGRSAADVILSAPGRFDVRCVTACDNAASLADMAVRLGAKKAVLANPRHFGILKEKLEGTGIKSVCGLEALEESACEKVDITLAGIVGIAGLRPVMNAIKNSRAVAIANKEPLVAAGLLMMEAAAKYSTKILPVDSEHNALFQVFDFERTESVEKIILTASGGPFRTRSLEEMRFARPVQALAHPNWTMGRKISINSATMMNKGLEIIEAHYLFSLPPEKIDVLVHPQSVIHSMVAYQDGSILAQMAASDMRTPLSNVLAWPERLFTPGEKLDFTKMKTLTFEAPDEKRFPALKLARAALTAGPYACIALNAANEAAVEAFLTDRIGFLDIVECTDHILGSINASRLDTIEDIHAFDADVKARAEQFLRAITTNKRVSAL